MFKSALIEWCTCDDCKKPMSLMDHWNQDGICVECFEKWMDEVDKYETAITTTV